MNAKTLSVIPAALIAALSLTAAAEALEPGSAAGSFAANGKEAKIAYAAAFTDQDDASKPVVLVLSDKELPASKWRNGSDMSAYRREHPFLGIAFWLDKDNKVFRTDYFDGTSFPTSASGLFELKLDRTALSLTGSAKSNQAAAKLTSPVKLDTTFNAALK
jgi:hypothetical protein